MLLSVGNADGLQSTISSVGGQPTELLCRVHQAGRDDQDVQHGIVWVRMMLFMNGDDCVIHPLMLLLTSKMRSETLYYIRV